MGDFSNKEGRCLLCFGELGRCYHLWTPENFEIIFRNADEFRIGMGIMAVAAKCFQDVQIITFELMTNHLHIMAAGDESRLGQMSELIKKLLMRMASDAGRTINWTSFTPGIRQLNDLTDARNVLIYDNRNGFLVHDNYTPFSYPWGANFCYFNPDAKKRFQESSVPSTIKDRRSVSHSHISDGIQGLNILDGCFSPFSFCDITTGEGLFRDAVHYFYMLGRNIESNKEIAKEIGESGRQVSRYIRLTELLPEILNYVDDGIIAMRPAVELSYIPKELQKIIFDAMAAEACTPSHDQTIRMRKLYAEGKLNEETIYETIREEKPNQRTRISINDKKAKRYLPKDLPVSKREDFILKALEHYSKYLERQKDRER